MADGRSVSARGIGVPAQHAETTRQRLREAGLLAPRLAPLAEAGTVYFPLAPDAGAEALTAVLATLPGATCAERVFPARGEPPGDYRLLLADLPAAARAVLPRAHDVVGDIAVLRLPSELEPHKRRVAAAILEARPALATVALDRGVKGAYRVRDLEVVAGRPTLATVHREHGIEIEVDLATTYFSPRLATERDRLVARIAPRARVLDLFAGVGALAVRVAREREPDGVCAIDLNPHAIRLLERNLQRNKVPAGGVEVRQGDARVVAPRTRDWDHVVMNLPHDAHRFLDVAAECAAPDGEIHLYAILERDAVARYARDAGAALAAATGGAWRLAETRHVRAYSPTMDGLGFTFAGQA